MEIAELIALLEAKIKLKTEHFDKVDRQNGIDRSEFLNHMRDLETVLHKLNLKGN